MEVAPGVHRFGTGPFNWYLIEDQGRLTLVDAGFPGHHGVFLRGLAEIGRDIADLEAILLTHSHADHTGFAARLQAEAGVPVFVHRDDREAIARRLELPWAGLLGNAWRPYVASILAYATGHGVFAGRRIPMAHTFEDGTRLDVPGQPEVLHVPGHTPGEVAFHLPSRGILLSGDTLITINLLTGRPGPPAVPSPALNSDDAQAHRSLERYSELGPVTLLPGHGSPWVGDISDIRNGDAAGGMAEPGARPAPPGPEHTH